MMWSISFVGTDYTVEQMVELSLICDAMVRKWRYCNALWDSLELKPEVLPKYFSYFLWHCHYGIFQSGSQISFHIQTLGVYD